MSLPHRVHLSAPGHPATNRLPLLLIPCLSTAFGAIQGTTIHAVLPMAIFGLAWGLVAAALAPRVSRWGAGSIARANLPLFLALPLAFIVLGGALLGNLLGATPQAQLALFAESRFGLFFFAIHTSFEWLILPATVMLNWSWPTRRWVVVVAAMLFYAGRVSSALYFAPAALAWGADPSLATPEAVQQWMNLNWIRTAVQDTATAVLLLLVGLLPTLRHDRPSGTMGVEAS
jgi:hypothetical protein